VLEILTLLMDRRNTLSQNGESGVTNCGNCRSHWPRGLRRGSAAACLLGLRVRITPAGMDVSCECCMLSGSYLCVGLNTRPEESYRMWCV